MFHVSTMLPYSKENKQQVRVNTQNTQRWPQCGERIANFIEPETVDVHTRAEFKDQFRDVVSSLFACSFTKA